MLSGMPGKNFTVIGLRSPANTFPVIGLHSTSPGRVRVLKLMLKLKGTADLFSIKNSFETYSL